MTNNMNLTQEKLEALRTEYKQRSNKQGKYPRQKMLPEYQSIYPWVMADEEDPYFAFCTVCECRLSAKRSDLGKHESSIKHTENSAKRLPEGGGIVLKGCHQSFGSNKVPVNIGDELDIGPLNASSNKVFDEDAAFIKQEPPMELVEQSSISVINLEELQSPSVKIEQKSDNKSVAKAVEERNDNDNEGDEEDDDYDDDEEEEEPDEEDDENSSVYEPPPSKRRVSETDSQSQHSSALEFLPVQVTLTEGASASAMQQRYSLRNNTDSAHASTMVKHSANVGPNSVIGTLPFAQLSSAPGLPSCQTPCKITIQKITQPRTGNVPMAAASTTPSVMPSMTISHQPNKLTSTVVQQAPHLMHMPMTVQMPFNGHVGINPQPTRDAFDLFFDSICTSVKALPPKLATEGKIRVMQLIGDLELRAIIEREQEGAMASASDSAPIANGGSNGTSSSQQNSTVASTTK